VIAQIIFASFCFFALIQFLYYFVFFIRLALHKSKKNNEYQTNLPISIIICAHNEDANLQKNLSYILNQQYEHQGRPNFEVLVVNDNSKDDSIYFLREEVKRNPHLNILNLTQESRNMKGKKFPLTMGIKEAKYEHLLLTDADCQPTSANWLIEMVQPFYEGKEIVIGYAPYEKEKSSLNKKIRFETFYAALQYLSLALSKIPYMGVGRNLAYTKSLFNSNKGFSKHYQLLSGDDDLFINAVANANNTAVVLSENTFMHSAAKGSSEAWKFQKKRHLSTGRFYKLKHKFLLALLAFSHFLFYVTFIACCFYPSLIFIVLGIFVSRWIFIYLIQYFAMKKLGEEDLGTRIWFYDIWTLWFYIKNIPSIFFKPKIIEWK
jgi:glycosyltransferase involved in cell wall biosynthesis